MSRKSVREFTSPLIRPVGYYESSDTVPSECLHDQLRGRSSSENHHLAAFKSAEDLSRQLDGHRRYGRRAFSDGRGGTNTSSGRQGRLEESVQNRSRQRRRDGTPSRQFVRDAWQDKPLFAGWDPRALELYISEGFRDRDDGQVELKCNPMVEATIFDTTGRLNVFEFAPGVATPVLLVRAAGGFITDWSGADLTIASGDRFLAAGDRRVHEQALKILAGT